MNKTITIILMGVLGLLFTGCKGSAPVLPNSQSFKQGNKDGCATAKGSYTKNSKSFKGNADYQDGWFYGRRHCNPARS